MLRLNLQSLAAWTGRSVSCSGSVSIAVCSGAIIIQRSGSVEIRLTSEVICIQPQCISVCGGMVRQYKHGSAGWVNNSFRGRNPAVDLRQVLQVGQSVFKHGQTISAISLAVPKAAKQNVWLPTLRKAGASRSAHGEALCGRGSTKSSALPRQ